MSSVAPGSGDIVSSRKVNGRSARNCRTRLGGATTTAVVPGNSAVDSPGASTAIRAADSSREEAVGHAHPYPRGRWNRVGGSLGDEFGQGLIAPEVARRPPRAEGVQSGTQRLPTGE